MGTTAAFRAHACRLIKTREGPLHPATIVDVYSRRVAGWTMDDNRRLELTERALDMALQHRRALEG